MDKALSYLALARKGGMAILGEASASAAARSGRAALLLAAADVSEHTWRQLQNSADASGRPCIRLPYGRSELGPAVGRTELAAAAVTDRALALALVQALDRPQQYGSALEWLSRGKNRSKKNG